MTRLLACVLFLIGIGGGESLAQQAAAPSRSAEKSKSAAQTAGDDKKEKDDANPLSKMFGSGGGALPNQPITTEIFSEGAFFDSAKSIGIFTGHVIVRDPRFNLQADKLTVYLAKSETKGAGDAADKGAAKSEAKGLEKAVAEGNVGMIREAPGENGGPPVRSIGRADTAIYTANDGNVELRGTPRVQSGLNSHIATSPDTVMLINQGGQLTTRGPSRTEIRQEPKPAPAPAAPAPAPPKP